MQAQRDQPPLRGQVRAEAQDGTRLSRRHLEGDSHPRGLGHECAPYRSARGVRDVVRSNLGA